MRECRNKRGAALYSMPRPIEQYEHNLLDLVLRVAEANDIDSREVKIVCASESLPERNFVYLTQGFSKKEMVAIRQRILKLLGD